MNCNECIHMKTCLCRVKNKVKLDKIKKILDYHILVFNFEQAQSKEPILSVTALGDRVVNEAIGMIEHLISDRCTAYKRKEK